MSVEGASGDQIVGREVSRGENYPIGLPRRRRLSKTRFRAAAGRGMPRPEPRRRSRRISTRPGPVRRLCDARIRGPGGNRRKPGEAQTGRADRLVGIAAKSARVRKPFHEEVRRKVRERGHIAGDHIEKMLWTQGPVGDPAACRVLVIDDDDAKRVHAEAGEVDGGESAAESAADDRYCLHNSTLPRCAHKSQLHDTRVDHPSHFHNCAAARIRLLAINEGNPQRIREPSLAAATRHGPVRSVAILRRPAA